MSSVVWVVVVRAREARTEELRQAFLRYRLLLQRLLEPQTADAARW